MGDVDPYYRLLGIPEDDELTYYRLLGVQPFEKDLEVISNAADRSIAFLKSIEGGDEEAIAVIEALREARDVLMDRKRKRHYDRHLYKKHENLIPKAKPAPPRQPIPVDQKPSATPPPPPIIQSVRVTNFDRPKWLDPFFKTFPQLDNIYGVFALGLASGAVLCWAYLVFIAGPS